MGGNRCRNRRLITRLNEKEYDEFHAKAEALGTTVSGLMRALATLPMELQGEAMSPAGCRRVVVFDRRALPELTKQIRMWGYHYDQSLHALNKIASAKFMRADEAARLMSRAVELLEGIDETRGNLEAAANELMLQTRAYLPLGRE